MQTERRFLKTPVTADGEGILHGKLFYGVPSVEIQERGKTFTEFVSSGAFKRSLGASRDVILTAGHQSEDPLACLARWPNGGLTITDTATGLEWSATLPNTATARDLHALVQRGVIKGASFEFCVEPGGDRWEKRGGKDVRIITAAQLIEINPVASPAYAQNTVEARYRSPAAQPAPQIPTKRELRQTEIIATRLTFPKTTIIIP